MNPFLGLFALLGLGLTLLSRQSSAATAPAPLSQKPTSVQNLSLEISPVPDASPGASLVGPQYLTKYTTTAYQLVGMPSSKGPVVLCLYARFYALDATNSADAQAQFYSMKSKYETPVESFYNLAKGRRWIVITTKRFFDPKTFKELPSSVLFESASKFPVPIEPFPGDAPVEGVPCG